MLPLPPPPPLTKVHRTYHPTTGMPALRFQHPTLAGPGNFAGWFEEKVLGP